MSIAVVFDTETTSKDIPKIIQSSYKSFTFNDDGSIVFGAPVTEMFSTSEKISNGAKAVHHILESDLVGKPDTSTFSLPDDVEYVIGHNINFDINAVETSTGKDFSHLKAIDTLAIARKVYPEADSHTVSGLMYMLVGDKARDLLKNAHSAEADIGFLSDFVLPDLIAKTGINNLESLYQFSENAKVPDVMPFGKHQGMKFDEIPVDYKKWVLGKADTFDKYIIVAIKRSMGIEDEPDQAPTQTITPRI